MFILIAVVFGCIYGMYGLYEADPVRVIDEKQVVAVIDEVRVIGEVKQKTSGSDDALAGAIVGGIFFGTPGAIAGAAVGSDSPKNITIFTDLKGCKMITALDGKRIDFTSYQPWSVTITLCALSKKGDTVTVKKIVQNNGVFRYVWQDFDGTVLPE